MASRDRAIDVVRRLISERRRAVSWLVAALVANTLVYGFGVYPLARRVANIEQRERAAAETLENARREFEMAQGTLTGKEQAAAELQTFYAKVLPQDLAGARRLTRRLPQLARKADLDYARASYDQVESRDSTLTQLKGEVVVEGTYEAVREFIHELDIAQEFVVIDDITLTQASEEVETLVLTLQLSTYFRKSDQ